MVIQFMGFSASSPPLDKLECRQAIAHALDRAAIARAVTPLLRGANPSPYTVIQPPGMLGHNPDLQGFSFNEARAKELASKCDWGSAIRIFVPRATNDLVRTFNTSIGQSVEKTLAVPVKLEEIINVERLADAVRRGEVPIYVFGEISSSNARGLPYFPLVLANNYASFHPEVKAFADRGDHTAVERILVEQLLFTGILWYRRT